MEFAIPISRFDPSHVRWGLTRVGPFRKTIPFGYEDSSIMFNSLILILEPLRVVQIDWERNQLVLEETGDKPFLAKLEYFQKIVNSYLIKNSKDWLEGTTEIYPLQPWLKSRRLTLYLSSEPAALPFYTDGTKATFSEKTVKPGDFIRAVVKLYGISLQTTNQDVWTGKSRIQHHVLELYKVNMDSLE